MRIIASAGSPNGWLEAMGYKATLIPGIFDGEMLSGYYLGTSFPDIKIPVDSDEIFVALQIDNKNFSRGSWSYPYLGSLTDIINNSTSSTDKISQRLFRILNSSGQIIASFGSINATANIATTDAHGIHTYEAASPKSPKASSGGVAASGISPLENPFGKGIYLHYKFDRTDSSKSFFRYYLGTDLIGGLTGSQLTTIADGAPAYFTVFSSRFSRSSSRGLNIRSMVIADSMDFTLKVVNAKPVTLNNAAQWTGSVADISEWLQAKTYLSTAVESNASFDIGLGVNNTEISGMSIAAGSSPAILSLKTFLAGRYVQTGGVSATFRVELFKSGVAFLTPMDIAIPANEDPNLFITRKVGDIALSENIKLGDLANITAKITLVG